ncbi:MAG: helix-turn-helix transcriptional regulator [Bacteroidia bacterium]
MNEKSYNIWPAKSDLDIQKSIGEFIKHHRLRQNKTQQDVATAAGMSRSTLSLLERGETVTISTLIQVLRVLDLFHVLDVFKVQSEISPILYAKMKRNERQRASRNSIAAEPDPNKDLEW